ncbi:hypothetical protein [Streptomyces sp. NPDC006477]|uniref:hypothetical protein n=1 Tax=Streptomyces sp. NPDC006477 TaxID=3364747 RepID=UPI0036CA786A
MSDNIRPITRLKRDLLSNKDVRLIDPSTAANAAALPYEIFVVEDAMTYDVKVTLVDPRRDPPSRVTVKIPHEKLRSANGIKTHETIVKAVVAAKDRLQEILSHTCDEPELRLWAARNREVDLLDNSEIPSRIRLAYERHLAVLAEEERLSRQGSRRAIEVSVEADSGPIGETPRPRRIVRKSRAVIENLEPTPKEKEPVPVKTVKGARPKTPIRKPRCQNRDHDEPPEMEYKPEEGLWRCPIPGCKMKARPKGDAPAGKVTLGKGELDFRVVFAEPGAKPSILLMAANNIALDVTDYVEMDKFLQYSAVVPMAQGAAKRGEKIITLDSRQVTALLRFPSMKVFGCDNA